MGGAPADRLLWGMGRFRLSDKLPEGRSTKQSHPSIRAITPIAIELPATLSRLEKRTSQIRMFESISEAQGLA